MMNLTALLQGARNKLPFAKTWLRIACIHLLHLGAHRSCICFISTPAHGNLGDQAIVFAQTKLVRDMGFGTSLVEITDRQYRRWRVRLERMLSPRDVIVIGGGGSIGTIWPEEEEKMRDILRRFPNNPVFIFPQTAHFEDDEDGRRTFEETVAIYRAHRHLKVYARDERTFALLRDHIPDKLMLTPDIVPYLGDVSRDAPRTHILLCLRTDHERTVAERDVQVLERSLRGLGLPFRRSSTIIEGTVTARNREEVLAAKWAEFSGAKLVVTDRLHGMIFCALTGTPCVALDNISGKVREGHAWLNHLPYIRFCASADEVEACAQALLALPPQRYDPAPLEPYYAAIRNDLLSALKLTP